MFPCRINSSKHAIHDKPPRMRLHVAASALYRVCACHAFTVVLRVYCYYALLKHNTYPNVLCACFCSQRRGRQALPVSRFPRPPAGAIPRAPGASGGLVVAVHAGRGAPAVRRLLVALLLGEGLQLWSLSKAACCYWTRCQSQRYRRSPAGTRARRAGAAKRAASSPARASGCAWSLCRATRAGATQRPPVCAHVAQ